VIGAVAFAACVKSSSPDIIPQLLLRVLGYERPGQDTGSDANWLTAEAELTADTGLRLRARRAVSLRTEEIAGFRDALRVVVADLDGEATLSHLEDEVGCTIKLHRGTGTLDAFIREHVPSLDVRLNKVPTDQSYLQETVRQLDDIVAAFPVKGDALG
jgi:hypothetical protein